METKKIKIEIDADAAILLDELIRKGLYKKGFIKESDTVSIVKDEIEKSDEIEIDIDPVIAARFSEIIRIDLIAASAAHQANNNNIGVGGFFTDIK